MSYQRCIGAAAALVLALVGCERPEAGSGPTPKADAPSVLLITLDTTRADRLGCYGYADARTPTLDALATSGVLFQQAFCQVPLTLPSHVSLLTGTYPATNAVRINGVVLASDGVATLAELFQARGYRTGAFIAASVLDANFGLARGFDVYDDLGDWQAVERPADEVCEAALRWFGDSPRAPFFAWVHFFDPHSSYNPPEPYRGLLADPYDGEIAFVDAQIQRLVDWLEEAKLRDRTLIVVAGDHGEGFREHGEAQHGLLVYAATMHVPLIFSNPASLRTPRLGRDGGRIVSSVVGLVDVLPTILELLGWEVPSGIEGVSLLPLYESGGAVAPRPAYGETFYPHLGYGWAPLRCLTTEKWKYIEAPRPELYDRVTDPAELRNVIAEQPAVASRLGSALVAMGERMIPRSQAKAAPDAGVLSRLETLGYVAGAATSQSQNDRVTGRDPKDMIGAYNTHGKAVSLLLEKRFAEVVPLMEPLVRQSPESDEFHVTLGQAYLELGRARDAQQAFEAGLRLVPDNPRQLRRLGEALLRQGKIPEAIERFKASLAVSPAFAMAHCGLGDALNQQGKTAEAIGHYELAVSTDPGLARAHGRLGVACAKQQQFLRAHDHLQRYVELAPTSPHALGNLGNVLLQLRRPAEAARMLRKALLYDPTYAPAHYSLFQVLQALRKPGEAIEALRKAHEALPADAALTNRLAWLLATASPVGLRNPKEAVRLAQEACESRNPNADDLVVLAAAYAASRDFAKAIETAKQALALTRANGDATRARQIQDQLRRYESGQPVRAVKP